MLHVLKGLQLDSFPHKLTCLVPEQRHQLTKDGDILEGTELTSSRVRVGGSALLEEGSTGRCLCYFIEPSSYTAGRCTQVPNLSSPLS